MKKSKKVWKNQFAKTRQETGDIAMCAKAQTFAYSLQECGTFLCAGADAKLFIKTMFTGDFQNCDVLFGSSCGLLLSSEAQVIDLIHVINTGNNEYLILTSEQNTEEDFEWLEAHANLAQDKKEIFENLIFENQTGKLASLLLFGKAAEKVYKNLVDICEGKIAFIASELGENSYLAPAGQAYLLFVPLAIAAEVGEILNEFSGLEMLEPDEYKAMLEASNECYLKLEDGKYYMPAELGLQSLLRNEKDFVGAKFLEEE